MIRAFDNLSSRSIYWGYVCLFAAVILSHMSTLSISPLPWMDEVQVIEMGRNGVLDDHPVWSLVIPDRGGCFWSLYYVGGVAQEFAYKLFRGAFGPRLLSLIGLEIAALLFLVVLKRKGLSPALACGVSLLYLVDPVVTLSVRGGRVDIWTTVCMLCSVLMIARLEDEKRKDRAVFFCVGTLSVFQLFVWAPSVLQLPIVLVEIWLLAERRKWNVASILSWMIFGFIGAACALLALSLPLLTHWQEVYGHFLVLLERNLTHGLGDGFTPLKGLRGCVLKSPFLCLIGGLALLGVKKNWRYAIFLIFCLAFVLKTRLYVHRFVHLTPYFVLAVGLALSQFRAKKGFVQSTAICFTGLGLLFGFGYSVFIRNISEQLVRTARSPRVLVETLRTEIGAEGTSIYTDTFQTYYAGRELGWRQYRMAWGTWWADGCARDVLATSDFFLTEGTLIKEREALLIEKGFQFKKQIVVPWNTSDKILSFMRKHGRPLGYGPYVLYAKQEK